MISRRNLLSLLGSGSLAGLASAWSRRASAQHEGHDMPGMEKPTQVPPPPDSSAAQAGAKPSKPAGLEASGHKPVRTLNGWTLPYRRVDGVKEFHLVAEEIEHEFAPGCVAKCWGYNGTTPGPTIEAVEGDRVRIYLTNRLREHTTIHWHGILLPSGMDGVGGLSQKQIGPG
ncbi:MAG: multicopper oxidase domain-containing protein, partial [Panacagrimonas sp.]